jgi:hypothetical protein
MQCKVNKAINFAGSLPMQNSSYFQIQSPVNLPDSSQTDNIVKTTNLKIAKNEIKAK